eukprot:1198910-Rhodomonas_salina.4
MGSSDSKILQSDLEPTVTRVPGYPPPARLRVSVWNLSGPYVSGPVSRSVFGCPGNRVVLVVVVTVEFLP